jgi:hypothetical protein
VAAFMDKLTDARLVCIHDEAGNLLLGKAPPQETYYSAEFLVACANHGRRK